MAVKLRLRREGAKKKPHFRVVAADSRSPRDGRFIEIIGDYHPSADPSLVEIDEERALHWLRHGAQPTSAVENLLRITGVWEKFKPGDKPKRVRPPKEARKKAEAPEPTPEAEAPQEAAPAEDAPAEETAAEEAPAAEVTAEEAAAAEEAPTEEAAAEEAPAEEPAGEAPDEAEEEQA